MRKNRIISREPECEPEKFSFIENHSGWTWLEEGKERTKLRDHNLVRFKRIVGFLKELLDINATEEKSWIQ